MDEYLNLLTSRKCKLAALLTINGNLYYERIKRNKLGIDMIFIKWKKYPYPEENDVHVIMFTFVSASDKGQHWPLTSVGAEKMLATNYTRQIGTYVFASLSCPSSSSPIETPNHSSKHINLHRRHLITALTIPFTTWLPICPIPISDPAPVANARGLFQMPPLRLSNRYFLVRAGESEFESMGVINTNPVAKTSVDSGLSEKGKKQSIRAAFDLKEMGACDRSCWIWPAITQRAYQTAEIIASVNGVSRSFIVPEYSFLDARGLGAYEGKNLESISEIYASDSISANNKPPPVDDGTPNESVADVFVRVTQLMSILETQYSADTIIIVSPDSDNLTILQAGLVGLDLRRHGDLSFNPGEVRFVDTNSIPTYKQPASAVYKCFNPPNCN